MFNKHTSFDMGGCVRVSLYNWFSNFKNIQGCFRAVGHHIHTLQCCFSAKKQTKGHCAIRLISRTTLAASIQAHNEIMEIPSEECHDQSRLTWDRLGKERPTSNKKHVDSWLVLLLLMWLEAQCPLSNVVEDLLGGNPDRLRTSPHTV